MIEILEEVRHTYFNNIDTLEKAIVLGWIIADGGVSSSSNAITLKLSNRAKYNGEHYDLIEKMGAIFNACPKLVTGTYVYTTGDDAGQLDEAVYFSFCSAKSKKSLGKLGVVPCKSKKDMSVVFSKVGKRFHRGLVLGIFDGDGSLSIGKRHEEGMPQLPTWDITNANRDFLITLKNIISEQTGVKTLTVCKCKKYWRLHTAHLDDIIAIGDWMYTGARLYLPRKKDKFEIIKQLDYTIPKSEYTGVCYSLRAGKWRVRVSIGGGKRKSLGHFADEYEAAMAREVWILKNNKTRFELNFAK